MPLPMIIRMKRSITEPLIAHCLFKGTTQNLTRLDYTMGSLHEAEGSSWKNCCTGILAGWPALKMFHLTILPENTIPFDGPQVAYFFNTYPYQELSLVKITSVSQRPFSLSR